jgi:WD40 repeat protein
LKNILNRIKSAESPDGWEKVTTAAIGGLTDLGFSKSGPYLLVISSQGRGVFDCNTGERIARDYDEYGDWFNERKLVCKGIGPIESETIQTCGIYGGGLPLSNGHGESIEVVAPSWPSYDLIFCQNYKSALIDGHGSDCCKIYSEHIRAYGFSWCGNYLVAAISSDFTLWKRL